VPRAARQSSGCSLSAATLLETGVRQVQPAQCPAQHRGSCRDADARASITATSPSGLSTHSCRSAPGCGHKDLTVRCPRPHHHQLQRFVHEVHGHARGSSARKLALRPSACVGSPPASACTTRTICAAASPTPCSGRCCDHPDLRDVGRITLGQSIG
jgi:hypothetical protein